MNQSTTRSLIAEHKLSCPRSAPGTLAIVYDGEFSVKQMIGCLRRLEMNSEKWDSTARYMN
jgi:hypothetical protein